ncbi:MAG: aspartate--tRNA(Asn) ligase [Candidatus Aenigmatarchaeota archaeon]
MAIKRSYSHEIAAGQHVLLKGWVWLIRDLGNIKFFLLRDREGMIQITAKKGVAKPEIVNAIGKLTRQDCVEVEGKVVKSTQAPGGLEVIPERIEIVSKAAVPLPIELTDKIATGIEKRFDYRFLDMRNPKIQAIFRIRDKALAFMREWFEDNDFVEVQTPVIQAAGAEGGATIFPIIYYEKEAFLRQSPQLYKQILMASTLDKVYEIGPAFRAELFHTRRHVSEFLSVDAEIAWIESEEDVLSVIEQMIVHTLKGIKKACKVELGMFERKLNIPELPFKRFTYDDVIGMLQKAGEKIEWGDDLSDPQEKMLGEMLAKKGTEWYFIKRYPAKLKPFYIMMEGKYSRGFDLDYRGMELASGGQREHRYEKLVAVMKEKGLNPESFTFYLEAFRFGMPPHGGFGLGADRFVQQIIGLENIKEAILFPRTPEKLVP